MIIDHSDDELPLLTEVFEQAEALPLLTEVLDSAALNKSPLNWELQPEPNELPPAVTRQPTRTLNPEEMQHLLQHLEAHLETVFTSKLNSQLEQLQRLAVDLAVSEFKAELPKLLLDALHATHPDSH